MEHKRIKTIINNKKPKRPRICNKRIHKQNSKNEYYYKKPKQQK